MNKKVLITGGTGLVGKTLSKLLSEKGYEISILSRNPKKGGKYKYFKWNIDEGYIDEEALEVDVIIHLAGAGIADSRWTPARKRLILESRVQSTILLQKYLENKEGPKPAYIGASAIGIYGNMDTHPCTEDEVSKERSFLVHIVKEWEKAHTQLKGVVSQFNIIRIGLVFDKKGGVLKSMLLPFKFRTGTYFGQGDQVMSWIHIHDLCRMIVFLIEKEKSGIYNGVGPHPTSGKELVRTIANHKRGPFLQFGIPVFLLKIIFGEMSETILSSTWVSASKIQSKGFEYHFPEIKSAISDLVN